jgi:hypothetical protein
VIGAKRMAMVLSSLSQMVCAEVASAQPKAENWVISETTSPVDYSPLITAANPSHAIVKDAPSSLAIRCRRERTELVVATTGTWLPSKYNDFRVIYQINAQAPVEQRWAAFTGGRSAIFRGDTIRFLQALPDSGYMSIRVYGSQAIPHEAIFHLAGLDAVRRRVAAVCKW